MSFPRYPEYKDSGVEWLGEIPAHWEVGRSQRLFGQRKESAREQDRPLTASQDYGVIPQDEFAELEGRRVVQAIKAAEILKHVEPDDFVISMRSFQGGIERSKQSGCISSAYVIMTPGADVYGPFFANLLKSDRYIQALQTTTNLVRDGQALRFANFTQIDLPYVPFEEQIKIAAFLDAETAKIDALVAEQERLIELLKEKRQALISHAVTRGLNPSAPMKDSGIEWIGEIPAHWEVGRVKSVSSFTTSGPRGWSDFIADSGPLFIQSGDLDNVLGIDFDHALRVNIEMEGSEALRTRLLDNDVVVVITGAKTGKVAWCASVPGPAYVNQHLCLIRPSHVVLAEFVAIQLASEVGQLFFGISQYGLKQGLSLEDVRCAPVLLPPHDEQRHIIDYMSRETAKLDALTTEAQRAIELLQERRSALISAAVTGKIDVR